MNPYEDPPPTCDAPYEDLNPQKDIAGPMLSRARREGIIGEDVEDAEVQCSIDKGRGT